MAAGIDDKRTAAADGTRVPGRAEPRTWSRLLPADLAVSIAFVIGIGVLGVVRSSMTDLEGDESWTRLVSRLPLAQVLDFLMQDGKHPPLYVLLQRIVQPLLPDDPLGLRAISVLAIASIPSLLYATLRQTGSGRATAVTVASWVALHPLLLEQAPNARSYALFACVALVHARALLRFILTAPRGFPWAVAASAVALMWTHAFGVLYVAALAAAALLVAERPRPAGWSARSLLMAHAPALLLSSGWFVLVFVHNRGSGGIASGLQWLLLPSSSDRIVAWGQLGGSGGYPGGTAVTVAVWIIVAVLAVRFQPTARQRCSGGVLLLVVLSPILAQAVVTTPLLALPLWGTKHVLASVPLAGLVIGRGIGTMGTGSWRRVTLLLVAGLTLLSTLDFYGWRRSFLSDFARAVGGPRSAIPIRVGFRYGDQSVLNYYLDRSCLDEYQLRLQFPGVRGSARRFVRSEHCVARAAALLLPSDTLAWFLLRTWNVRESRELDSIRGLGARVLLRLEDPQAQRVVELVQWPGASGPRR